MKKKVYDCPVLYVVCKRSEDLHAHVTVSGDVIEAVSCSA